jgi:hypothetical protein
MKTKIFSSILGLLIVSALALNYGCVKESTDTVPSPVYKSSWHGNMTIAKLRSYASTTGNDLLKIGSLFQSADSVFIEGVVVSNDVEQNFYKVVTIQDSTGGIDLKINDSNPLIYVYGFAPGQRVIVHVNDLYLSEYNFSIQLCSTIFDNGATTASGINPPDVKKNIQLDGSITPVSPTELTISQIKAAGNKSKYLQTLIKLNNVKFIETDLGKTWANSGATTNRTLVDADGNQILVRTSGFAKFASDTLPSGTGSMVAVLSVFGTDYQLYIRDLNDVSMDTNPRSLLFSEGFDQATPSSPITINGWKDIATAGTKTWLAQVYNNDIYAEANAYNSGQASNVMWLISPAINLPASGVNYLSFNTEYNYWAAGTTLQAYASTDFDGTNVDGATWTELTSANIVTDATAKNVWVNSGKIDLSAFSGNVYVAFKYTGSGLNHQTTAYRVDNVVVLNLEQ